MEDKIMGKKALKGETAFQDFDQVFGHLPPGYGIIVRQNGGSNVWVHGEPQRLRHPHELELLSCYMSGARMMLGHNGSKMSYYLLVKHKGEGKKFPINPKNKLELEQKIASIIA